MLQCGELINAIKKIEKELLRMQNTIPHMSNFGAKKRMIFFLFCFFLQWENCLVIICFVGAQCIKYYGGKNRRKAIFLGGNHNPLFLWREYNLFIIITIYDHQKNMNPMWNNNRYYDQSICFSQSIHLKKLKWQSGCW